MQNQQKTQRLTRQKNRSRFKWRQSYAKVPRPLETASTYKNVTWTKSD